MGDTWQDAGRSPETTSWDHPPDWRTPSTQASWNKKKFFDASRWDMTPDSIDSHAYSAMKDFVRNLLATIRSTLPIKQQSCFGSNGPVPDPVPASLKKHILESVRKYHPIPECRRRLQQGKVAHHILYWARRELLNRLKTQKPKHHGNFLIADIPDAHTKPLKHCLRHIKRCVLKERAQNDTRGGHGPIHGSMAQTSTTTGPRDSDCAPITTVVGGSPAVQDGPIFGIPPMPTFPPLDLDMPPFFLPDSDDQWWDEMSLFGQADSMATSESWDKSLQTISKM